MLQLKTDMRNMRHQLKEGERRCESSSRQVAYLRSMIANSQQLGNVLRSIRWGSIIPQSSNINKTLNELNSRPSTDHFPITSNYSLFDGYFDFIEDSELERMAQPSTASRENNGWAFHESMGRDRAERFQETVPSKYVSVCMLLP